MQRRLGIGFLVLSILGWSTIPNTVEAASSTSAWPGAGVQSIQRVLDATAAASATRAEVTQCAVDQAAVFTGDSARLREWIGNIMGDPTTCPSEDPAGTADSEQATTTGLVYSHSNTGSVTFTTNSYGNQAHWTMNGTRLLYWEGPATDPTIDASPVSGCTAVLAAAKLGGVFTAGFGWGGLVSPLGRFNGSAVVACLSTESFPGGNAIWCLLADDRPAPIDAGDACLAFTSLTRVDASTLVGVSHESAALDYVRYLRWNDGEFNIVDEFESCKTIPAIRVPPAIAGNSSTLANYCHYTN